LTVGEASSSFGPLLEDISEGLGMKQSAFLFALVAISGAFLPRESQAQVRANFSYDAIVNCTTPMNVRDYPVHFDGSGTLSTDRSASLDMRGNLTGQERYDVKLGGRAAEVPDGTASLRVVSRKSLRAIREYPNNTAVINLRVSGSACAITVEHHLKPGKRQYTFTTPMGLAYCDRPRTVKTSCTGS
jgi:hypothetical protein